jgi:ribA/ribD-fused uncharacterized protein
LANAKNAQLESDNKQLRNDLQALRVLQAAGIDPNAQLHPKIRKTGKPSQVSVPMTDSNTQTSDNTGKDPPIALFRSDGNLSELSNFYRTKLKYRGVQFPSAEHAYQHAMALFHSRPDVAYRIQIAHTPAQAKRLSKSVKKCEQWHEAKPVVMLEILRAKAKQCLAFKEKLLATSTMKLVHNIDTDSFWGCGPDFQGANIMGKLLEELRENLQMNQVPEHQAPSHPENAPSPTNPPIPDKRPPLARPSSSGSGTQLLPVPECHDPPVLILGNSNVRQMANILSKHKTNPTSVFYPGGTLDYIRSRVRHTTSSRDPSHIVVMAGDIEIVDGMHPEKINASFEQLVREIRRVYPWSRVILVCVTNAGNLRRRQATQKLNALMQHLAATERMISFTTNDNSQLRDKIHISHPSKVALGRRIANLINKPHLDFIQRFR